MSDVNNRGTSGDGKKGESQIFDFWNPGLVAAKMLEEVQAATAKAAASKDRSESGDKPAASGSKDGGITDGDRSRLLQGPELERFCRELSTVHFPFADINFEYKKYLNKLTEHKSTSDSLREEINAELVRRSGRDAWEDDTSDLLLTDKQWNDRAHVRNLLKDSPELLKRYERLTSAEDAIKSQYQNLEHDLAKRQEWLQKKVDRFTDALELPRAKVVLVDFINDAAATYTPGAGVITLLKQDITAGGVLQPSIIENIVHEVTHLEQDALLIRWMAGKESGPISDRKLAELQLKYNEAFSCELDADLARRILAQSKPLNELETRRAERLFDSYKNDQRLERLRELDALRKHLEKQLEVLQPSNGLAFMVFDRVSRNNPGTSERLFGTKTIPDDLKDDLEQWKAQQKGLTVKEGWNDQALRKNLIKHMSRHLARVSEERFDAYVSAADELESHEVHRRAAVFIEKFVTRSPEAELLARIFMTDAQLEASKPRPSNNPLVARLAEKRQDSRTVQRIISSVMAELSPNQLFSLDDRQKGELLTTRFKEAIRKELGLQKGELLPGSLESLSIKVGDYSKSGLLFNVSKGGHLASEARSAEVVVPQHVFATPNDFARLLGHAYAQLARLSMCDKHGMNTNELCKKVPTQRSLSYEAKVVAGGLLGVSDGKSPASALEPEGKERPAGRPRLREGKEPVELSDYRAGIVDGEHIKVFTPKAEEQKSGTDKPAEKRIYAINGREFEFQKDDGLWFYYDPYKSADIVPDCKLHVTTAGPADIVRLQKELIPLLADLVQKGDVLLFKTFDPNHVDPQWVRANPEKCPKASGQRSKGFTIYVSKHKAAEVADRIDKFLKEKNLCLPGSELTGNLDDATRLKGESKRVSGIRDIWKLTKATIGGVQRDLAVLDSEVGAAALEKYGKYGTVEVNGGKRLSPAALAALARDCGIAPGQLLIDQRGRLLFLSKELLKEDSDKTHSGERNESGTYYADESHAEKTPGKRSGRPALYALYEHLLGKDPYALSIAARAERPLSAALDKTGIQLRQFCVDKEAIPLCQPEQVVGGKHLYKFDGIIEAQCEGKKVRLRGVVLDSKNDVYLQDTDGRLYSAEKWYENLRGLSKVSTSVLNNLDENQDFQAHERASSKVALLCLLGNNILTE